MGRKHVYDRLFLLNGMRSRALFGWLGGATCIFHLWRPPLKSFHSRIWALQVFFFFSFLLFHSFPRKAIQPFNRPVEFEA